MQICPAGTILKDTCTECPVGTFSLGGASQIVDWSQLSTTLGGNDDKELKFGDLTLYTSFERTKVQWFWQRSEQGYGWIRSGGFIRSGLPKNSHYSVRRAPRIAEYCVQRSVLQLSFSTVRSGSVQFTYQVDAEENFDGL